MARSQNTQGAKVIAITTEWPEVATLGKTTDGRFTGENTGAALYRPQKQTAKGAIIRPLRWTPKEEDTP